MVIKEAFHPPHCRFYLGPAIEPLGELAMPNMLDWQQGIQQQSKLVLAVLGESVDQMETQRIQSGERRLVLSEIGAGTTALKSAGG